MDSGVLLAILTALAVVLAVFGGFSIFSDFFLKERDKLDDRLKEEFRQKQRDKVKRSALFNKNLSALASEAASAEVSLSERFQFMLEQSGIENLTAQKLFTWCFIAAIGFGLFGYLLCPPTGIPTQVGALFAKLPGFIIGGLIGGLIPLAMVRLKQKQRIEKMRHQLPDVFDLMARVIRAGQTMTQAMQGVADEFVPPISEEFLLCYEQMNLGISPDAALRDLARRTGIVELQIFVMALLIQRQTGGNLAEMLDNLAAVIRERFLIQGEIAALTAEGRLQAIILLALPVLMVVAMFLLNRPYAEELLARPALLVGMGVMELLGAIWIRSIVNFDF